MHMFSKYIKIIFILVAVATVSFSFTQFTQATSFGDSISFNVDPNYDASVREQVQTILVKTTPNLYFYVEKTWWETQVLAKQNEILINLNNLSFEFENKIYPTLTSVFGSEWKPGVDGDGKITVLFHSMKEGASGYFRSSDEYIKLQVPNSNEREMLYLSILDINSLRAKVSLAHEFVHLITFNQKDKINDIHEETWLNEARADYTANILGYDNSYEGSNLQSRVKDFLNSSSDSLTEWQEKKYDYATANLFIYYLIDHYGINMLSDSLKSKLVGILSINEALLKNGYEESFEQIFTDWTIATIVNDCSLSLKYCYLNKNLVNFKINPALNFLPLSGNSSLSVTNVTKNWSGNWQKIIGGNGNLKLEFLSTTGLNFQIPYITFDKDNNYFVTFLKLDKNEKGQIEIKNFGEKYNSLIIAPSLQTKIAGFDGLEFTYPYTFTVSITGAVPEADEIIIQKLLAQIDVLKKQIAILQFGGNGQKFENNSCFVLNNNLYLGVLNIKEVKCLQDLLKLEGLEVYPEGLITGYFGNLTKSAVIRFQKKYGILQTGFVGLITRTKINQILSGK